ncbi:ATP synthase subunit I [Brevibacillus daliensis]|uniref:ATP synthase subunit I n=1 Tax=Brevibacillus daliensis TaxID=2892995 RepID=UPI001E2DF90F|nr:ATP synthase subunit I [Brevibacillus daliensis]
MQNFTTAIRHVIRLISIVIAVIALLWFILPEHRIFLQSLLVGALASLVNGLVLFAKTWRVGRFVEDPSIKPRGTGMVTRFAVSIFAVFLAVRFTDLFVISGVLLALFLFQAISLFFIYRSIK